MCLSNDNTYVKNGQNKTCETPLMIASGAGFVNVVQLLLDCKADTNLEHRKSGTALYYASYCEHTEQYITQLKKI